MASVDIPAQFSVILDDEKLKELMLELWPNGPSEPNPQPGGEGGLVLSYASALFSPGHAIPSGNAFLDTPHLLKITPKSVASRIVIEFSGRFGATELSIIDIALKRNNSPLSLPPGSGGFDSPRIDFGADSTTLGLFKAIDFPGTTSEVTYRVIAKNRNGTGYFGRRGFDQIMNSPLFMSLTEYAA